MPSQQARNWTWTLNNYENEDLERLQALGSELPEPIQYLIFAQEVGEGGTPHLQGYISFTTRKTFNYTKSLISERAHIETSKGSPQQNKDYCSKASTPPELIFEFGRLPGGQGRRTDLANAYKAIKEGASFRDLADQFPTAAIRYGSGLLRVKQLFRPERTQPPQIWVFWGNTGVGKTRRVWEFADTTKLWEAPGGGRWFDGYDLHESVLFDDFAGSWWKLDFFLKLLDRYPFRVEVKGGFVWWAPKHIYITTNIEPENWYPNANEAHRNALKRRLREFGTIEHCT